MAFPGDKLVPGRYCGKSIYVGLVITVKILINNGQQVHISTHRSLTPDELVNPDKIKSRDEFDTAIEEKLGPAESAKDSESDPKIVTPTLDWYEDDE